MELTFAPRGILQIDDARIIYRNFAGVGSKYNREGDRNFAVVIPDRYLTPEEMSSFLDIYRGFELMSYDDDRPDVIVTRDGDEIEPKLAEVLTAIGWNVKIKPPRDEEDEVFMCLPVKIKFNDRGPSCYLVTGNRQNRLDEESIGIIDDTDIMDVKLDIRPYDWEVNGKQGRSAYLQAIEVTQEIDRFAARYQED